LNADPKLQTRPGLACTPGAKYKAVRRAAWVGLSIIWAACSESEQPYSDTVVSDATSEIDIDTKCDPPGGMSADCDKAGLCAAIAVAGDPPALAKTSGTFRGYADSMVARDPKVPGRLWLVYSWPRITLGKAPSGAGVQMATVSSHLARSDNHGKVFTFVRELYPASPLTDPEGSGEEGIEPSEAVSLAVLESPGGKTTWYGAHLRYFLRPIKGYNPLYATSWTVRIGAAASPPELGDAEAVSKEAVLGVSNTAAVYKPTARLDKIAGLSVQHCAMLNNPALFARQGSLYLIVECLAFVGTTADHPNTTVQVFKTTPTGDPSSWTWSHAGKLSDDSLAQQLGVDALQQPEVAQAADGSLLFLVTPANIDTTVQVKTLGSGCVAIEMTSLDPPQLKRNCDGTALIRATVKGKGHGACTYDSASNTGIIAHVQWEGHPYTMHASGLKP
jgi:hypothetical protein